MKDESNNAFWSELCGSHLAKVLGIEDDSAESLKKFDDWYLDFYPYLERHLPQGDLTGKSVLEIGLGYGTVSSLLMRRGADYTGLDVAEGPVLMNVHRAKLLNKDARSVQGSACEMEFGSASFDHVVSIGCLHHTGDLPKAISEVERVLKPAGSAHIMVYNALSYRQWLDKPMESLRRCFSGRVNPDLTSIGDARYDANEEGDLAPETVYVKKAELKHMFKQCRSVTIRAENIGADGPFERMDRNRAIRWFGSSLGLDLYVVAQKIDRELIE